MIPTGSTFSAEVGARLREVRRESGKNQTDFGREFGVSRNSQVDYEAGKSPFNVDYLGRLSSAGVDVAYLLTGRRAADSLTESETAVVTKLRMLAPGWVDAIMGVLDQALHPFGGAGHAHSMPEQDSHGPSEHQHTLHDHRPEFRAAG